MGNRGDLHAPDGSIAREWRIKAWLACTLVEQDGYRVTFDTPGRYAPLFFLDEAVALSAGHRPCARCRRAAYTRFRECWRISHGVTVAPTAATIDAALHAARIHRSGQKVTTTACSRDLPDGAFVMLQGTHKTPFLLWRDLLHPWSHSGYGKPLRAPVDVTVNVLTPAPTIEVLRAGYQPYVAVAHPKQPTLRPPPPTI